MIKYLPPQSIRFIVRGNSPIFFCGGWFCLDDPLLLQHFKDAAVGVAILEWEDEIDRLFEEHWEIWNKIKSKPKTYMEHAIELQPRPLSDEWKALDESMWKRYNAYGAIRAWKDWRKGKYDPNYRYTNS